MAFTDVIFSLFYVMTEGAPQEATSTMWKICLFMQLADMTQVLRSLASPKYGWSEDSAVFVMQCVDPLFLFTSQVRRILPYAFFYGLAIFVVLVALLDSAYVVKLLRSGHVKIIWPLKVLRFMVGTIVTTVFSTALEWLIYPVDCETDDTSLSNILHGPDAACTPWGMPEVLITVPSLLLALLYIVASLGTTWLSFETNPLSNYPLAGCTGRVETCWTLFKVLALFLIFLGDHVSFEAVTVILTLYMGFLFTLHLKVQPFHHTITNVWRGGIYAACLWFSFSCFIMTVIRTPSIPVQFVFIGLTPIVFLLGMYVSWNRHQSVLRFLAVVRHEWELHCTQTFHNNNEPFSPPSLKRKTSFAGTATVQLPTRKTAYDQFFESAWQKRKTFMSSGNAYAAARHLLSQQNEEDIMFLQFLIDRGLVEHPESDDLLIFQLMFFRFISRDTMLASAHEKALKLKNSGLSSEHEFLLYAVTRRATQESVGASLGKGSISAVNLIEFDAKMNTARKAHQECISAMKKFWKRARGKGSKKKGSADNEFDPENKERWTAMVQELIACLDEYEGAVHRAKLEYQWLLEKYPASSSLLLSYAHFSDTVLNDPKGADAMKMQATMLEEGGSEAGGDLAGGDMPGVLGDVEAGEARSVGDSSRSSNSENARIRMWKYVQSWMHLILGTEEIKLVTVHNRVKIAFFLLIVLSTVGFSLIDLVLFNDVALNNLKLIASAGQFRTYAASSAYFLRSAFIAALQYDLEAFTTAQERNSVVSDYIKTEHLRNYEATNSGTIREFYERENLQTRQPIGSNWKMVSQSFWTLGNDWARRSDLGGYVPMEELRDTNFAIQKLSESKRNFAYVHENVFRHAIPAFEKAVLMYTDEVLYFGWLSKLCVYVNVSVNAVLLGVMALSVLAALRGVVQDVQHKFVLCHLGLVLPTDTIHKIYNFYRTVEEQLILMDDEEAEKQAMMAVATTPQRSRRGSTEGGPWNSLDDQDGYAAWSRERRFKNNDEHDDLDQDETENFPPRRASPGRRVSMERTPDYGEFKASAMISDAEDDKLQLTAENLESHSKAAPVFDYRHKALAMEGVASAGSDHSARGLTAGSPVEDASETAHGANASAKPPTSPVKPILRMSSESSVPPMPPAGQGFDLFDAEVGDDTPPRIPRMDEAGLSASEAQLEEPAAEDEHRKPPETKEQKKKVAALFAALAGGALRRSRKRVRKDIKRLNKMMAKQKALRSGSKGRAEQASSDSDATSSDSDATSTSSDSDASSVSQSQGVSARPGLTMSRRRSENPGKSNRATEEEVSQSSKDQETAAEGGQTDGKNRAVTPPSSGGDYVEADPVEKSAPKKLRIFGAGSFKKLGDSLKKLTGVPAAEEEHTDDDKHEYDDADKKEVTVDIVEKLRTVTNEGLVSIKRLLLSQQKIYYREWAYVLSISLVLGMCVFSIVFPARNIDALVNVAPTSNQASRRVMLVQSCVHLSRELVLNDGLSRMEKGEVAGTMVYLLDQLREADKAIRLGNAMGIGIGADKRTKEHNQIMYNIGCPWRDDPNNCTMPVIPKAAENGLFALLQQFIDAIENIIDKYGPEEEEYVNTFDRFNILSSDHDEHQTSTELEKSISPSDELRNSLVLFDEEKLSILRDDISVAFVLEALDGDLSQGLNLISKVFEREMNGIVETVHLENRAFFGTYMAMVLLTYLALFRKTMDGSRTETNLSRQFIAMMPSHVLEREEVDLVKRVFSSVDHGSD